MGKRPRIGITMRLEAETRRFYLGRDYSDAVEACGGIPLHLALIPKPDYVAQALSELDGLLLPGSKTDLDPHYYNEEPRHELGMVVPEKDETDLMAIAEADRLGMPILAICYGMQALNVARGGTLIQDIRTQVPDSIKHEQGIPVARSSHSIDIASDSILSGLASVSSGKTAIRVNSSHHQAIGKLGSGLRLTAWAKDSVIESIEGVDEDRFVLGVQWHPELSTGHDRLSYEIFSLFVTSCRQRADADLK